MSNCHFYYAVANFTRPPPPGFPFPPGALPPGMMPPPGMSPPPPGMVPMPPPGAMRAPFPPPNFVPGQGMHSPFPPVPPSGSITPATPASAVPTPPSSVPPTTQVQRQLVLPNPALSQTLPPFKKETDLKYKDPNFSPVCLYMLLDISVFSLYLKEERRACHPKYLVPKPTDAATEESRGKKRARAEDFL